MQSFPAQSRGYGVPQPWHPSRGLARAAVEEWWQCWISSDAQCPGPMGRVCALSHLSLRGCLHRQQDLFRVLKAYTLYRPEEGYCQAQAPIAAVLLMHMPAEVRAAASWAGTGGRVLLSLGSPGPSHTVPCIAASLLVPGADL